MAGLSIFMNADGLLAELKSIKGALDSGKLLRSNSELYEGLYSNIESDISRLEKFGTYAKAARKKAIDQVSRSLSVYRAQLKNLESAAESALKEVYERPGCEQTSGSYA